uniref:ShKT domain-containing protein n=1 Tax=Strongyloides stercoralis TaxID=6248 RepID=A0A0K0EPL4_STRER
MLVLLLFIIYFDSFIIFGVGNIRCNYDKSDTISTDCLTAMRNDKTYYFCFKDEGKVCVPHPTNFVLTCCNTNLKDPIKELEDHLSKLPTTKKPLIPYTMPTTDKTTNKKFTKSRCYDQIKNCYIYSNLCYKSLYLEIMDRICKKTCNLC